jgi:hypothetical protein
MTKAEHPIWEPHKAKYGLHCSALWKPATVPPDPSLMSIAQKKRRCAGLTGMIVANAVGERFDLP